MFRETCAQPRHDSLLGAAVGLRYDVDFALVADLHWAVKLRHQDAAGLASRIDSNFEKRIHASGVSILRRAPSRAHTHLRIMPELCFVRQAQSVEVPAGVVCLSAAHLAFAFDAHFERAAGTRGGPRIGLVSQPT